MNLIIIGAGAAGMAAALAAAENPETQVILLERQARVGRKLQATGNGRCNLTNLHTNLAHYHGEDAGFVAPALSAMGVTETLAWFRKMGLFTVAEESGKVYPYSDHANSVVDVLRLALCQKNITLRTGFEVTKIAKSGGGFVVSSAEESLQCDRLIVACGGLAGTKLGGSMSGYKLLGKLGHKSTRLRPSLVQLKSNWGGLVSLKGVRTNCNIKIYRNDELYAESTGELQFTDYGISGPVVFEVSRDVCQGTGKWSARLDVLPDVTAEELKEELIRRTGLELPAEELLTGVLHNRLGRVFVKASGISGKNTTDEFSAEELDAVVRSVKSFEIILTEPMGMENAQVTAGGVQTSGFDSKTMESKLIPGLYACGEVLDIDGDCGGFNLQWAWSSGYIAGKAAGGSL